MAISFDIPSAPVNKLLSLDNFLGVDYNNLFDSDIRHSPEMINMHLVNGYLKKRNGLKSIVNLGLYNKINGIYQFDIPIEYLESHPEEQVKEVFFIHSGTELYSCSTDFSLITLVMSDLENKPSYGAFLANKLVILDGKRAIIVGQFGDELITDYIDNRAYIPLTTIGLNPNGTGGTSYESVNLMTQFRTNSFSSDGTSLEYITDSSSIDADKSNVEVKILNESTGAFDILDPSKYSIDSAKGSIILQTAIPKPTVVGSDNVIIKIKSTTYDAINQSKLINKCTFCTAFGYQGNNNRLFFSGNPEEPNVDWHSDLVAALPDPTYIPDTSFAVIGTLPIKGYLRMSDGTLAILKDLSDTDCSIYYRTSNASGSIDVFPLLSGTKNVGCISHRTCLNVENNPLFLSSLGLYQTILSGASYSTERFADNKSYYVNPRLLKEEVLENAFAASLGSEYYLFINSKVYICDTSRITQSMNTSINQYQWVVYDNIQANSVLRWNDRLIIGDDFGNIKMFTDGYIDDVFNHELELLEEIPVRSYFETLPLDFGDPVTAKTTRQFTLNYQVFETTKFDFGYKTIDEDEVVSDTIDKIIDDNNLPTKGFPNTITLKEKARKLMFMKFFVESDEDKACQFDRIFIQYRSAGKYRGE